jgi:uncharacterized protein YndB with AHSA1/START domain
MTTMKTTVALAGALFVGLAIADPTPDTNGPPAWYLENIRFMTADGGTWIADNTPYQSDAEPWDAYGLEWTSGPGGYSMSGRLFGIRAAERSDSDFWLFSQYWDPARQKAVVQQYGWGTVGLGSLISGEESGDTILEQTMTGTDGSSSNAGHRTTNPSHNVQISTSYDIDESGEWTERRTYRWLRRAPGRADWPTVAAGEPEAGAGLMAGKRDTGRTIEFRIVVDGSPEEIFHRWTDSDASTRFFGNRATIEPRPGGIYEIGFDSPTRGRAGPVGTKVLRYEPPSLLFFEWEMPKFIDHLNSHPLPTWVELRFERFGVDGQTEIHFFHRGFGDGPDWDQGYVFFLRNWFDVLYRLKELQSATVSEG